VHVLRQEFGHNSIVVVVEGERYISCRGQAMGKHYLRQVPEPRSAAIILFPLDRSHSIEHLHVASSIQQQTQYSRNPLQFTSSIAFALALL
jgi:hypothetical protein